MKKIFALLLAAIMLLAFAGCNNDPDTSSTEATVATIIGGEIAWDETKADPDIVGAWQLDEGDANQYYIFTEDCKVQRVRGTVFFEGEATYGVDTDGIHSYFSNFEYLFGQLTYTIEGDTLTFLDTKGVEQVLKRAEYTAPVLTPADDFKADESLVGYWHNEEFMDSYVFTADGYASYDMDMLDSFGWVSNCDYTYTVADGTVVMSYHDGSGLAEQTFEYSINGDTLTIDGNEYIRADKPAATE